ncbi:MAG: carbohydrate-binding domain-containing protein [Methanocorpusculum sp.]|nr:carbohydrate-binding domain-containing protein [Methanocorpusculum sp.]
MKKILTAVFTIFALLIISAGCIIGETETEIVISDSGITVNGETASQSTRSAVYVGAEIIYYEEGQGSDYGEGKASDAHSVEEAEKHTVITITEPGTYRISGKLSYGQIAVDLGYFAEIDKHAKINIILDGVDITCTAAPAIVFYNVFETESTETAGAVITVADNSENFVNGSYIAKIYEEGSTDTLYKHDGAISSQQTLLIQGEEKGNGILTVNGELEGISTKMHLTVNGGNLYVYASDDAINVNEERVSVFTMNGGFLYANGKTDGVDSNGDIVLNSGTVISYGAGMDVEGGIDPDGVTILNGGNLLTVGSGAMSADSTSPFMKLSFTQSSKAGSVISVTDTIGNEVASYTVDTSFSAVLISSENFEFGKTYYVYVNGVRQQYTGYSAGTSSGSMMPAGDFGDKQMTGDKNEMKGGRNNITRNQPTEFMQNQQMPQNITDFTPTDMGGFGGGSMFGGGLTTSVEASYEFTLTKDSQNFSGVYDGL